MQLHTEEAGSPSATSSSSSSGNSKASRGFSKRFFLSELSSKQGPRSGPWHSSSDSSWKPYRALLLQGILSFQGKRGCRKFIIAAHTLFQQPLRHTILPRSPYFSPYCNHSPNPKPSPRSFSTLFIKPFFSSLKFNYAFNMPLNILLFIIYIFTFIVVLNEILLMYMVCVCHV